MSLHNFQSTHSTLIEAVHLSRKENELKAYKMKVKNIHFPLEKKCVSVQTMKFPSKMIEYKNDTVLQCHSSCDAD